MRSKLELVLIYLICFYFSKLQQIHTIMTLKKYTIYDKRAKYNNTVKYSQKVT